MLTMPEALLLLALLLLLTLPLAARALVRSQLAARHPCAARLARRRQLRRRAPPAAGAVGQVSVTTTPILNIDKLDYQYAGLPLGIIPVNKNCLLQSNSFLRCRK